MQFNVEVKLLAMVNYFAPMLICAWGFVVIDWLRRGQADYVNGGGTVDHDVDFLISFCGKASTEFQQYA